MRFIQVGVGGFGKGWLGRVRSDERASLAAIVDVDRAALESARQETGLSEGACFEDFRRAFSEVQADAVLNVTPPAVHHKVALAAFERGLHVLTEKPLADTMAHARQMVTAAEEAGLTLMVSQNYRFRRWVRTIRYLLREDGYGPADNVSVRFARAPRFEGSWRLAMEHPLVVDMSIHHFDLMRALTGREPLSVYAVTWRPSWSWFKNDPCCMAVFTFQGGLTVSYDASWVARGRQTGWDGYWRVECADATVELLAETVHVILADQPNKDAEIELHEMPCENQDYALFEFQNAVAEGREPEAGGRDNLNSLAMVFATLKSASTGRPAKIDSKQK